MLHSGWRPVLFGGLLVVAGCGEQSGTDADPAIDGASDEGTVEEVTGGEVEVVEEPVTVDLETEGADAEAAAEEPAAEDAGGASGETGEPLMVRPESLEQGFIIVADDPARVANASDPITLGCIWGGWDPGRAGYEMEPRSDGRWQIELNGTGQNGTLAWKFTRGNWDTVEMTAEGEQIDNRLLPEVDANRYADGSKPIFEYTIAKWIDMLPQNATYAGLEDVSVPLEVAGRAERVQIPGGGGAAASMEPRDAIVWVPAQYDDPAYADEVFPVLYLLDGQNLFYAPDGSPRAEWMVDEVATGLMGLGEVGPAVIVGVPHAGVNRASEYLPLEISGGPLDGVDPSATEFVEWMEYTVLPRVERGFRVRSDARGRLIGGASLGAIAAMYAATERPDLFSGGVIAESPSLLVGEGEPLRAHFLGVNAWPERVYLGMGGAETGEENTDRNAAYVAAVQELGEAIEARGVEVKVHVVDDHSHNERAWRLRLTESLPFVLPAE